LGKIVANLCLAAVQAVWTYLLATDGINAALADIAARDSVELTELSDRTVRMQNVPPDVADQNEPVLYPSLYVYCDRIDNRRREKFTRFSGPILLVVEVRVSGERFIGLEALLARYVEAATRVLEARHGTWTEELAYDGAYEVQFREIRLGGRNFLQAARIEVEVQAHA
jgi:hypothetical protein